MSRWSQLDTDEERLPEGFQRIGYDADDQTYTFRDADGQLWESAPGNRYGQLRRVGAALPPYDDGEENNNNHRNNNSDGGAPMTSFPPTHALEQPDDPSWRSEMRPLLNWFLLVGLFLLFIFWYITPSKKQEEVVSCAGLSTPYAIQSGDTCWAIAEEKSVPLEVLLQENKGLDCDKLRVGETICIPSTV